MSFLDTLYKEMILEHYKNPRNHGSLEPAIKQEGLNPSCGDEIELYVQLEKGNVSNVTFLGEGCAISQASASMMTEAIKGKSIEDARALSKAFKAMIQGEPAEPGLGDLKMLQGVSKLHARVKCATLAWVTLEQALSEG